MVRSSDSQHPPIDWEARYKVLEAANASKKKRKCDDPPKRTQARGRGIRKVAVLFGDIATIIADTQAYKKDPYTEDHGLNEFSKNITPEQLQWLADKRSAERNYEAYLQIKRLIPDIVDTAILLEVDAR
ncbi:hypothetical protein DFH07DRAFT_966957 [Mycena maculata]|uniref:Uncharacterized protein n=1 Tax=Mycena maculata TaxID=230809 RepID=A0AAD7I728_9AGAR|nr:hypothetical protein DFH07DRAFT_966957 [Mycena maculata]